MPKKSPKKDKFPFTKAQLDEAGLVGDGLSAEVRELIEHWRAYPQYYGSHSLTLLKATNDQALYRETVAAARVDPSALSTTTDGTPYALSDYEKLMYYQWEGKTAPALLYRSDLSTNPFPMPPDTPPAKGFSLGGTQWLNVWDREMMVRVDELIVSRGIEIQNVMLATVFPDEEVRIASDRKTVVWVTVTPGCATAQAAHDVAENILALLEEKGVTRGEVTVEFCEGYWRSWGSYQNYISICK